MFSIAGEKIAPANLPDEWSEEAARFMLVLRSLIADTRDLPKWEMSGKEWGEYLRILFTTYLKPIEPADEEAFQNLLRNVQTASYLDFAQEYGSSFSFSTIHQFFKQKIQSSTLQRGHYLAEGVTVSSFQPMRPIPFKAVFLLGLGEGMFPTPYQHDKEVELRRHFKDNPQDFQTLNVDWFGRMRLIYRKVLGFTVYSCTRGKNKVLNIRGRCGIEYINSSR